MNKGYWGRILLVDLSSERIEERPLPDDVAGLFLGGKGFAYYYMYRFIAPHTDPLGPGNTLVFAPGMFSKLVPGASKVAVAAKSPLTGLLTDSYAGDYFAPMLRGAGFDALVIRGSSSEPVYLWVSEKGVELRDARHIWGMRVSEATRRIRKETDPKASVAAIGPAGERLVRIAHIVFDEQRAAGRGGLGAVMGSKRLKAVAVRGTLKPEAAYPDELAELGKKYYDYFASSERTLNTRTYGTTNGLLYSAASSMSPAYNFSRPWIPEELASRLAGKEMLKRQVPPEEVPRFIHGASCPVKCARFVKASYKGREILVKPEYESLAMLGAATGVFDPDAVLYFNYLANELGIDSISAGATIAWFLELAERGMLGSEELAGLGEVKGFGDAEAVEKLLLLIAERKGMGAILAEGVKRASEILGRGREFAVHVKGLESAAWDPRGLRGYAVSYATADVGASHLRGWPSPRSPPLSGPAKEAVASMAEDRDWKALRDSLGLCIMVPYRRDDIPELYRLVTGKERTIDELLMVSRRAEVLSRIYAVLEGVAPEGDTIPPRWMEPIPEGPLKGSRAFRDYDDMREAIREYYRIRGWHEELGSPLPRTVEELGLGWLVEDAEAALRAAEARLRGLRGSSGTWG